MEKDEVLLRVRELISEFGCSQNEFADKIGTDRSNFSKLINGKLPLSDSFLNKIVVGLAISKEWLMHGKGNKFYMEEVHSHSRVHSVSEDVISYQSNKGAPVYSIDVTAGFSGRELTFTDEELIGNINVPFVNPKCKIVKVSGDSMLPVIANGDMIAIREVKNLSLIFWGQIYVVVLDDYRMVKYIRKHSDPSIVILRSANAEYDDLEIQKSNIRRLFIVENILRFDTRV